MFKYCGSQRHCRCGLVSFLLLMTGISCEKVIGQTKSDESKKEAATREVRNAVDVPAAWSSRYRFNVSLFPVAARLEQASRFRIGTAGSSTRLSPFAGIRRGAPAFGGGSFAIKGGDPTWKGGAGNWSVAANWNGGVPTATTDASIDGGNPVVSPVTLDIGGAQVRNLTIDSDDSLNFNNGTSLTVNGSSISNAGKITLNSTGSGTELIIANTGLTLSGGGSLTMSNNTANVILGSGPGATLINQQTIQGAGSIQSLELVNSGTINANAAAGMAINASGGLINIGTIEATGGTLALNNSVVNNTAGTISSAGHILQVSNSTINGGTVTLTGAADLQLSNSTIENGTLNNSSTGTVEAIGFTTNTLADTINNPAGGLIKVNNGALLDLQGGNYPTLGTVQLNSTANATELQIIGNVTLSGGSVTLSNNANNFVFGNLSTDTLTNQETIQGAGNIGNGSMTLVNSGTINANQSAGLTIQANGGTTNTGTIEATGGTLLFTGTTVNNTGGTISSSGHNLAVTNSTINGGTVTLTGAADLQMSGGTIQGGTLNNSSTGIIEALSFTTNTLGGTINNPAGGVVKVDNGALLNLQNGNYSSLGAVQLNSTANATQLQIVGGNATLSGGSVTLSNNANNFVFGSLSTDTLTNQETIQGAGNIGDARMTLVNSGTINANQSAGLTIQANGGTTNIGTIEATGGTLLFTGTTVNNTGGTISSAGQNLQVTNSTINGGTVTLTGTGGLQLSNSTIQGGTLNSGSTGIIEALAFTTDRLGGAVNNPAGGVIKVDNGAVLSLANGTYANTGSLQVNSTGSTTQLQIRGSSVTLGGGGTVALSNNANNLITSAINTNVLTNQDTIQGAGNIGNGFMGLVNSGTISANQGTPLIINPDFMGFNNQGTLSVSSGDLLHVSNSGSGLFLNFLGNTLSGGTYNVNGGTLQIDQLGKTGGEIVNNAAVISLNGTSSSFVDSAGLNALTNLAANSTATSGFSITGGANFTTAGNFTNNGTLTVGSGSTFKVNGNLTNFSGTTLTGGTYNVTGTLQFNGANIVTNSANITLSGATSQIQNQTSGNGLANFATNSTGSLFSLQGSRNFMTAGNFTNNGTLTVGSGSTFKVNGNLTNFSGTTLTGGIYNVTGTLQFNGANIVTNSANITLSGATSQILNQTSGNGLANFATNSSSGVFSLGGGRTLTTTGSFTNAGSMVIGSGSMVTVGGTGTTYTQTGGSTLDDGNLALSGTGLLALNGGTLFGMGSVTGAVKSSGTVSPGNAASSPGVLKETGAYTQNSGGTLAISVGGTTVGTQFDQFNPSTATLGGALTTTLINGFTPSVGQTFTIMNFTSRTGTFASCDGRSGGTTCPINSAEHFNITYNANSVVLTVASGAAVVAGVPPIGHVAMGLKPSASALLTKISAYGNQLGIKNTELAALGRAVHQDRLSGVVAFRMRNSVGGPAIPWFAGRTGTSAAPARLDSIEAMQRSGMHGPKMAAPRTVEYNLNLLPLFGTSPKRAFGSGVSFGSIDTH